MDARTLQQALVAVAVETSGHEQTRDYLGFSQISRDEGELVQMLLSGETWHPTDEEQLRLGLGYVFQREMEWRLEQALIDLAGIYHADAAEIVCKADARFRGHTDGEIVCRGRRYLVEIKSVTDEKLQRILDSGRLPRAHFEQVQCYLYHGGYREGFAVYVARDTGRMFVLHLRVNERVAESLTAKALRVLAAVDARAQAA